VIPILIRPARVVSAASRRRKVRLLASLIEPGASVLVVGVSAHAGIGSQSLVENALIEHYDVTGLTYEQVTTNPFDAALVRADGRCLPFRSGSFDYVVSNAVIEHLGGRAGAAQLIAESRRVARRGWFHMTPNRRFPIEVHTGVPFVHWLPTRLREPLFAKLGRPFPVERYCLFTASSLRHLAPSVSVRRATGSIPSLTLLASDGSVPSSRVAADAGRSERVGHGQ
jgi:Methyltransferase domain